MHKKHTLTLVLATVLAGAAPAASALAEQQQQPAPTKPQTKITMKDARTRALREVPGTVLKEDLKQQNGRWIFTFDIRPTGASPTATGTTRTVNIDADTGAVVPGQGGGTTGHQGTGDKPGGGGHE